MSKYDNRKFYWLQLKEDFFDEDDISYIEEQPNGKLYSLFYLKLCLKSLKTNGILIKQVGDVFIPYNVPKLAQLTKTEPEIVKGALKILKKINLVKVLENGELYLSNIEKMIGSQSVGAFKKEQQRMLKQTSKISQRTNGGQLADNCPPDIEIDIDKDIDIYKRESEREKDTQCPPTLKDIETFIKERKSPVNAKRFYDYYSSNKWRDKNNQSILTNWQQRLISWEKDEPKTKANNQDLTLTENEKEFYGGTRNGDF